MLIRTIPRRHPEPGHMTHDVWQHLDGSLTCNCPAGERGIKCWALEKVAAELVVARILKSVPRALPRFPNRVISWGVKYPEPTLEQVKAHNEGTKILHKASAESFVRRYWAGYYRNWT